MNVPVSGEPVAVNGALSILTAAGAAWLVKRGIDGNVAQALGGLALAELSAWGIYRARTQVTPVAAPKANDGTPLVPLNPAAPAVFNPPAPPVAPLPPAG